MSNATAARARAPKTSLPFEGIDALAGAHPSSLRRLFREGAPADPEEFGEAPRGRVLGLESGSSVFLAARPLARLLSRQQSLWSGLTFDHGGNSGQNVFFGRKMLRFTARLEPSLVDELPALVLHYDQRHPWPLSNLRDELRSIAPGVGVGVALVGAGANARPLFWWGLERTAR
jgi:hypothetical protein